MPQDAFFCSITAAALMGVPLPLHLERSLDLHVAVPHTRRAPRGRGVIGHSVRLIGGDIRQHHGLRISSPERLWCELGSVLSLHDLVAAGDFLINRQRRYTTKADLERAIQVYPRRGRALCRVSVLLLSDRADSRPETHLRVIVTLAGFSGLVVNLRIVTSSGYVYFGDLAFPREKLILEYQGDYHRDREQFRKDMTRKSRLEADGWRVMLINADDLRDADELVQRIRLALKRVA